MRGRSACVLALAAMTAGCAAVVEVEPTASVELATTDERSVVLDADGGLLAELHAEQDRESVPLEEVPEVLRDAVLTVEDSRFFDHAGVDGRAVARAFLQNAREGRVVEGGSTITQQLAKNLATGDAQTLERKLEEASVALQLEARMSKDEILERYLNTVYFGNGAYGVQAASQRYFGVDVDEVGLAEAALLAGLVQAPSRFDPVADPEAAEARRRTVLDLMRRDGVIDEEAHARADAAELGVRAPEAGDDRRAPYFVQHVLDQLQHDERFAALGSDPVERADAVFRGGLTVETTLDPHWQHAAEEAVASVVGEPDDPRAALVAIDPATGGIGAMVGGRDWNDPDDPVARYNLAVQARRQPGSTFKAVALAAALDEGWSLGDRLPGVPELELPARPPRDPEPWTVTNYDDIDHGEEVSLREATTSSINTAYAELTDRLGADRVAAAATDLGVEAPLVPYRAITLGAQEVSVLDMARVKATLAAGGVRRPTSAVTRVIDVDGEVLYERGSVPGERVVDEAVAWELTTALEEVVAHGTGERADLQRPVAGKTGTSQRGADAWFAGYTPDLAAAVWIGFPEGQVPMVPPRTRTRVEGGTWPAELFSAFGLRALADVPASDFPVPDSELVEVAVHVDDDCLPGPHTPRDEVVTRAFLEGEEPTDACPEPEEVAVGDVPDVAGLAADDAVAALEGAGFAVEERPIHSDALPPGHVVRQRPEAGGDVVLEDGFRAVVWASSADRTPTDVPDVLGDRLDAAVAELEAAGFVVDVEVACPGGGEDCAGVRERPGRVWEQRPDTGATPPTHSVVEVSAYPEP